jgi:hypothetical protein
LPAPHGDIHRASRAIAEQLRPVVAAAMIVLPLPQNGS